MIFVVPLFSENLRAIDVIGRCASKYFSEKIFLFSHGFFQLAYNIPWHLNSNWRMVTYFEHFRAKEH